jgi:hypothetical protein
LIFRLKLVKCNGKPDFKTLAGKGSRKNKFAILADEAPGRQDAKKQEYLDMPSFRNAAGRDGSASKM